MKYVCLMETKAIEYRSLWNPFTFTLQYINTENCAIKTTWYVDNRAPIIDKLYNLIIIYI